MARILIAEDNEVTAEMMTVRLSSAGHEVTLASNGREALEHLAEQRPDLVLLDMMMPEVDGAEFLQRVKADALLGSIPVLVVSARSREEDILAALAAGADDYVTKPFSLRELLARIEHVLSQGPEPLRVAVQGEATEVCVGEVTRSDPRSATVRFHRDGAPIFAIGDRAKLALSSPWLEQSIELAARVSSRSEAEPHRSYGFQFETGGEAARSMTRAFLDVIGRRGAVRVPLEADAVEVQVLAQAPGGSQEFVGHLLDVSTGGARLRLKGDAERELYRSESFETRFRLPGADAPLTLTVDVRHRVACDEGVIYGVRFDAEHSPDAVEQLEQLSDFVLGRAARPSEASAPGSPG